MENINEKVNFYFNSSVRSIINEMKEDFYSSYSNRFNYNPLEDSSNFIRIFDFYHPHNCISIDLADIIHNPDIDGIPQIPDCSFSISLLNDSNVITERQADEIINTFRWPVCKLAIGYDDFLRQEITEIQKDDGFHAKIDFLGIGKHGNTIVGETLYFENPKAYLAEILDSVDCGRPIDFTLISKKKFQEYIDKEEQLIKSEMDISNDAISEYCNNHYKNENGQQVDFDLER